MSVSQRQAKRHMRSVNKARLSGASTALARAAVAASRVSERGMSRLQQARIVASSTQALLNRRGVASKETGFVDNTGVVGAFDTTGTIVLVATIAQGASVNQRVGKKVVLKSIQVRGSVGSNATTTTAEGTLILVYDKRPTGALPAITDILVTISSNSMNNDANSGRFRILRRTDWVFTGNSTTPATGNELYDAGDFIKLNGLPMVFKAAGTGAIGDIEEGAIYAVCVGNTAAGTAAAAAGLNFRTRFVDV